MVSVVTKPYLNAWAACKPAQWPLDGLAVTFYQMLLRGELLVLSCGYPTGLLFPTGNMLLWLLLADGTIRARISRYFGTPALLPDALTHYLSSLCAP